MHIFKKSAIVVFFLMIIIPVATMNLEEEVTSEIDNRMLTENPFKVRTSDDFTMDVENYVQDRVGFRNEMILAYTEINDMVFDYMVHPTYTYGKDDYVFLQFGTNKEYGEFEQTFAEFVEKTQQYCDARSVPYLFVLEPSKSSVYQEKLPDGYLFDDQWEYQLLDELESKDVNYLNTYPILREKYLEGEMVFNRKYDAGHWNDLGAFYGVNSILSAVHEIYPSIKENTLDDFTVSSSIATTLPVSTFPINEEVPDIEMKSDVIDLTEDYVNEVKLDSYFDEFEYFVNPQKADTPKILVFQGSYMNSRGYKYMQNALGEYIIVHDYQNIINLDYYYNLFQPDYVIFEAADYTLNYVYFDPDKMEEVEYNPSIDNIDQELLNVDTIEWGDLSKKRGKKIVDISYKPENKNIKYAYLKVDGVLYDMDKSGNKYTVSLLNENINNKSSIEFIYVLNK